MKSTTLKTSATLSYDDLDAQQQQAITRIYENNTLLIAQAGFGKTVVAQTTAQELLADDVLNRIIIFAPSKVCDLTWQFEWQEWEHLREPAMATGNADSRRAVIENPNNAIVVINFENVVWFFNTYGNDHGFDGLVIDEGSKAKNASGALMKKLHPRKGKDHLSTFVWRLVMSATPVHESGTDIYTQVMIVDGGKALGTNQEKFRRKYFMQMDFKGYKWGFQPGGAERLAQDLADLVFVADTEDYEASLPAVEEVTVPVSMPKEAWDAYDDMCGDMLIEVDGKEIEAPNMGAMTFKLQHICCGAVYHKKEAQWLHEKKFHALEALLLSLDGAPAVIVYQWDYERDKLVDDLGPMAERLDLDPEGAKARWNEGKLRYLLVHPKSAGHGLNIQLGGCRMVALSPLWSADQWDQLIRRLRRRGQPSDIVWRYTLCVPHSIEAEMLERQAGKLFNASAFVEHLRKHANAS